MATKSGLTSAIGSAISIVISRAKLLLGLDEIIDEFFPATVTDDETTTNVITKVYANIEYDLKFKKIGNTVYVNGTIKNIGTTFNAGETLATFSNSLYRPLSTSTIYVKAVRYNSTQFVLLEFNGGAPTGFMKMASVMPSTNVTYYINDIYTVND